MSINTTPDQQQAAAEEAASATVETAEADGFEGLGLDIETDFYDVDDLLTDGEREVRDRVRAFCDTEVIPVIAEYWEEAQFPFELVPGLAELGIVGGTIEGHGAPGLSNVADGLVKAELARGDGSISTFLGVHSGLAMKSIALLGSDEQRERWLPPMARLEILSGFGLTEPDHGSDAVALATTARRDGGEWVLDGAKRWIGNGTIADMIVVWARDDDDRVGGFLIDTDRDGYAAEVIRGKMAKRSVWQAAITLDGVRIPADQRLAGANSFADTSRVLTATRQGVAWEAFGHATAAFETALDYARRREQFGQPLASFQLVQEKLATMVAEVTSIRLLCHRLSQLADAGTMTMAQASMAKRQAARQALHVCTLAADVLGGNSLLAGYRVARHLADMQAVVTYEGTDSVQALIVGRDLTGETAFT